MKKVALGCPLLQLQSVDSTNNYASRLFRKEPVTEGTVILAVHQTGGRGQGGNQWVSEKGMNLLLSIILKPDFLPASKQFYLSMSVATGIQQFISDLEIPALIKWPNDILTDGRKLSGILIENTVMGTNLGTSVIGIGLNINQKVFPADLIQATSFILETGKIFDLSDTLQKLLRCLEDQINLLYQGKFMDIKTAYLNRLWMLNTWMTFTDQTGRFTGRIVDVAESGELAVKRQTGESRLYGFKEIVY
jgi:BirA family biotin operon repressor/biotin-[acetyl-CoA-carboxylase] ligase